MCGICGIYSREEQPIGHRLHSMNEAQAHRGPDGEGYFLAGRDVHLLHDTTPVADHAGILGLAHRRLSILDPSCGQQPMEDPEGRAVVLLNGEIYNFRELREDLKDQGVAFRTDSDTEVVLQLYLQNPWDPHAWLARLNGIFSLVIWDQSTKRLLLARDHFGVKPLHYLQSEKEFLFASEIKSLLAAGVRPVLNRAALHVFMNVRYVPDSKTLFKDVFRFPPASFAWVQDGKMSEPERYYQLPGIQYDCSRDDAREQIKSMFYQAVERQLVSDVPVGISLSGGLDSSMNVAAASSAYAADRQIRSGDRRLRTFSLGFNEPTDEVNDARCVADHFKTLHTEQMLTMDPLQELKQVIWAVEEPKVNILQGYVLARMVKNHVKVLLSGLGGDELFAGYDIHRFCRVLGPLHQLPGFLQQTVFSPISRMFWLLQERGGMRRHDYYRIGGQILLSAGDRSQFYARLRNAWDYDKGMYKKLYQNPDQFMEYPATNTYFAPYFHSGGDYLNQVLRTEFQTKMMNDFLLNEDRVTSAHGVEGRVPFLDRELVELGLSLPSAWKMHGRETKKLWKDSVCDVLPAHILQKKKQGFTFSSYHQWLKDLRPAVEAELTPDWCNDFGVFQYDFIKTILDTPAHPNLRWHYFMLWMMLGFKTWTETFHVESDS